MVYAGVHLTAVAFNPVIKSADDPLCGTTYWLNLDPADATIFATPEQFLKLAEVIMEKFAKKEDVADVCQSADATEAA